METTLLKFDDFLTEVLTPYARPIGPNRSSSNGFSLNERTVTGRRWILLASSNAIALTIIIIALSFTNEFDRCETRMKKVTEERLKKSQEDGGEANTSKYRKRTKDDTTHAQTPPAKKSKTLSNSTSKTVIWSIYLKLKSKY